MTTLPASDPTATATLTPARRSIRTRIAPATLLLAAGLALGACSSAPPTSVASVDSDVTVRDTGATAPPVDVDATDPPATIDLPTDDRPTTSLPAPDRSRNVQVTKDGVVVHAAPDETAAAVVTLPAKTELGSRTTLLVVDEQDGWYEVALPIRPNGSTGWVEADDVKVRENGATVHIDLATRTLTVLADGAVTLQTSVAIGAGDTPTPVGDFYVTDLVQNDDPTGAYGPYALGLSGHSETLTEFGGGDGQIGVHGTNDPSSIGRDVSHGCIRLPNDLIAQLAASLPLGTPVRISSSDVPAPTGW